MELHKRTCTGPVVVATPAVERRVDGAVPEFVVRRKWRSLGGASEKYAVDMQQADHLSALQGAVSSVQHSMTKYNREHCAYKFQMDVYVAFHKVVDPAIITQPPITLTSEMVAVYAGDAPPLEIYEHNGSGWVFSNFSSLQFTLWHLDPLRASAFVPLLQQKKAVVNVIGTDDDCFKWGLC